MKFHTYKGARREWLRRFPLLLASTTFLLVGPAVAARLLSTTEVSPPPPTNYCFQITVVADKESYWQQGTTHTSTVKLKNNCGTTIPKTVTISLNNRMFNPNGTGRTVTSLPSQTTIPGTSAAAGVGCIDLSSTASDGFTAQTKCTFNLNTPLGPGGIITGTYRFNFVGLPLTVARSNGYSQVFYDCAAAQIVTSGWIDTAPNVWCSEPVPFGIKIQKSLILTSASPTTDLSPPVILGSQIQFGLTVKNLGPATIGGVSTGIPRVIDTLPQGLSAITASGTNWTCNVSGQTVTCNYSHTGPIKLTGQTLASNIIIGATANTPGSFSNCATTQTILYDPVGTGFYIAGDSTNNSSCVNYVVAPNIDVGIDKEGGSVQVNAYTNFILSPHNFGPGTITSTTGLIVTDTLPANFGPPITFTLNPATPPSWSCGVSGQTLTCTYIGASVGTGLLPKIIVKAKAVARGAFTNCANISLPTAGQDSNTSNNTKCVSGQVLQ